MNDIYILNDMKIEGIKNIPLLGIRFLPNDINFLEYDALIFTSKSAAYSIDSFNQDWKKVPSYVIASKTAKVIKELGGNVAFIGNSGHGNDFACELMPVLKNKKALYLRAKKVVSNLMPLLKNENLDVSDIVVYETACNTVENIELPSKNSVIIFSSPSTIECFFNNFSWDESYKAVVIGETTAKYLPKDIPFFVSKTTSIEDCIALASKLALDVK